MGVRIQFPQIGNQLRRKPRGRMHGQIDRNERSLSNRGFVQRLSRQVELSYVVAVTSQPRRG